MGKAAGKSDSQLPPARRAWVYFFSSSLSASVIGGSTKRNIKETLCELCDSSVAGGE